MSPINRSISSRVLHGCEWIFAWFGAAVCIGVVIKFATYQFPDLWLLPGLYFLEIIFLALLILISRVVDIGPIKKDSSKIAWLAGGVLLAFVILAMFSIGPFLFPAMLAFWLAATIGDIRHKHPIPTHLALTLVAAFSQAALIGIFFLTYRISIG